MAADSEPVLMFLPTVEFCDCDPTDDGCGHNDGTETSLWTFPSEGAARDYVAKHCTDGDHFTIVPLSMLTHETPLIVNHPPVFSSDRGTDTVRRVPDPKDNTATFTNETQTAIVDAK